MVGELESVLETLYESVDDVEELAAAVELLEVVGGAT